MKMLKIVEYWHKILVADSENANALQSEPLTVVVRW